MRAVEAFRRLLARVTHPGDTLALVAIGILVAAGAMILIARADGLVTIQCDGTVPTWMITDENAGTGCIEVLAGPPPRDWDGSWICIGLCDGFGAPSPFYPKGEP